MYFRAQKFLRAEIYKKDDFIFDYLTTKERQRMTKKRKLKINSNMTLSKWIFFAVTCGVVLALYIIFCVVPILQSVKMSFFSWDGFYDKAGNYKNLEYLGWKNYTEVFKDAEFWVALKNDLIITLIKEVVICFLTVLFAVTLTRFRMKTPEVVFYKFVFYVPNVISTIIIGSLWGFVFMPSEMGLMNAIFSFFKSGFDIDWIAQYPLGVIGFVASWCGVGLFMLTMIASIHQIPAELYEAARIDGAGEMKQLKYITMPAVWLQVTFMVVSILYQSLGGNFALVNVFSPDGSVMVMGLYVYIKGYVGTGSNPLEIGYSYAAALIMLLITCVISLSVKFAMNKVGESL